MYECFACMRICTPRAYPVPLEVKGGFDPLGLELRMTVSHHVGAVNETWVLSKSIKDS